MQKGGILIFRLKTKLKKEGGGGNLIEKYSTPPLDTSKVLFHFFRNIICRCIIFMSRICRNFHITEKIQNIYFPVRYSIVFLKWQLYQAFFGD